MGGFRTAASVVCLAVAIAPLVARADVESADLKAEAIRLGHEGSDAYKSGNYAVALEKFEAAYRILPVPPLALNLARTELKLGHCDKALSHALTYSVAFGESPTASVESPDVLLAHVRSECPEVEITSDPSGASLLIEGVPSAAPRVTPWKGRLPAGVHWVRARLGDLPQQRVRLSVNAGTSAQLYVTFAGQPVPTAPPPQVVPTPVLAAPIVVTPPAPAPPPVATPAPPSLVATEHAVMVPSPVVSHPVMPAVTERKKTPGSIQWIPWVPTAVVLVGGGLAIAEGVMANQCPKSVAPTGEVSAADCQTNHAILANTGWVIAGVGAVATAATWLAVAVLVPSRRAPPVQVGVTQDGLQIAGRF